MYVRIGYVGARGATMYDTDSTSLATRPEKVA